MNLRKMLMKVSKLNVQILKYFSKSKNILGSKNPSLKLLYEKTNEKTEKWSKILFFLMVKFTPIAWLSPKVIISFYLYFTTDLGNDALELPSPMW